MLVVVAVVCRVAVSVMDVVDVVAVRYGDVTASFAVDMLVPAGMLGVIGRLAFIHMVAVNSVNMPVMDVVDVVAVRYGDVTASLAVDVLMARMRGVDTAGHSAVLPFRGFDTIQ